MHRSIYTSCIPTPRVCCLYSPVIGVFVAIAFEIHIPGYDPTRSFSSIKTTLHTFYTNALRLFPCGVVVRAFDCTGW